MSGSYSNLEGSSNLHLSAGQGLFLSLHRKGGDMRIDSFFDGNGRYFWAGHQLEDVPVGHKETRIKAVQMEDFEVVYGLPWTEEDEEDEDT